MPPIELEWTGGERFRASTSSASDDQAEIAMVLDGDQNAGFSPTGSLLAAVGGCMGIDVVLILQKMRARVDSLRITVDGERRDEPPRSFHSVTMRFDLRGEIGDKQAERAVSLSKDKYCSVLHTLRRDLEVATEVRIVSTQSDDDTNRQREPRLS